MVQLHEESGLVATLDGFVDAFLRKLSLIVIPVENVLIAILIPTQSGKACRRLEGIMGILCKNIQMHALYAGPASGLCAKDLGEGRLCLVCGVFTAGECQKRIVGQIRMIQQNIVVGLSNDGVSVIFIDLLHLFRRICAIGAYGVAMHIGAVPVYVLG